MDRCLDILLHSDINRMNPEALGVVFAPNLFSDMITAIGQGNRFFVSAIAWRKRTLAEADASSDEEEEEDSDSDESEPAIDAAAATDTPIDATAATDTPIDATVDATAATD